MSDADFCRKTGLSPALVSIIKRRPPSKLPKQVQPIRWAKILDLTSTETTALHIAALLAWSPEGVLELVTKQKT